MSISPSQQSQGLQRLPSFKILQCSKTGMQIHFGARRCRKYALYPKMLQMKKVTLSRGLLMFSNTFQELSVSLSVVNFFKVTNLCKNDINIREIWRDAPFFGSKFVVPGIILNIFQHSPLSTSNCFFKCLSLLDYSFCLNLILNTWIKRLQKVTKRILCIKSTLFMKYAYNF